MIELGGNTEANKKYELYIPEDMKKLKPDASNEERSDFIRYYSTMSIHVFHMCTLCHSNQALLFEYSGESMNSFSF